MKQLGFIFILFFSCLRAQYTTYPMISIGYSYQSQSFGEVGGKILFIKKDEMAFRAGGSVLLGSTRGKFAVIPKIQGDILFNFRKNVDVYQGFYYMAGLESTTKYLAPYIGINVLGILDFTGGYAFAYSSDKNFYGKNLKGVKLGLTFNIPLVVLKK